MAHTQLLGPKLAYNRKLSQLSDWLRTVWYLFQICILSWLCSFGSILVLDKHKCTELLMNQLQKAQLGNQKPLISWNAFMQLQFIRRKTPRQFPKTTSPDNTLCFPLFNFRMAQLKSFMPGFEGHTYFNFQPHLHTLFTKCDIKLRVTLSQWLSTSTKYVS